jgi:hypothetical protein
MECELNVNLPLLQNFFHPEYKSIKREYEVWGGGLNWKMVFFS